MPKTFKQFEEYDKACDEVIFEHENEPLQDCLLYTSPSPRDRG